MIYKFFTTLKRTGSRHSTAMYQSVLLIFVVGKVVHQPLLVSQSSKHWPFLWYQWQCIRLLCCKLPVQIQVWACNSGVPPVHPAVIGTESHRRIGRVLAKSPLACRSYENRYALTHASLMGPCIPRWNSAFDYDGIRIALTDDFVVTKHSWQRVERETDIWTDFCE